MVPPTDVSPQNITILPGFWPTPSFDGPSHIVSCPCSEACLAINCSFTAADSEDNGVVCSNDAPLCAAGHTSRLCSDCTAGYFAVDRCCKACPSEWITWGFSMAFLVGLGLSIILLALQLAILSFGVEILLAVVGYLVSLTPLWLVVLLVFLFLIALLNRKLAVHADDDPSFHSLNDERQAATEGEDHEHSTLSHGLLKVVVFFLQVSSYLQGINIIAYILPQTHLKLTGLSCLFPTNSPSFFSQYLFYLLLPFLGAVAAALVVLIQATVHLMRCQYRKHYHRILDCRARWAASFRRILRRTAVINELHTQDHLPIAVSSTPFHWAHQIGIAINGFIFYCFVIYPDMSDKLFSVLKCDQEGYIEEHPFLLCGTAVDFSQFSPASFIFISALLYLACFSVGFPVLCFCLLYKTRDSRVDQSRFGFLTEAYRPSAFFWSIYSFARILVLLSLINFLPAGSFAVLVSVSALLLTMAILQIIFKPFETQVENLAELFCIMALLLIHLTSQFIYSNDILLGSTLTAATWFLFLLNIIVVLSLFSALLWPSCLALPGLIHSLRGATHRLPSATRITLTHRAHGGYSDDDHLGESNIEQPPAYQHFEESEESD